MDKKHLYESRAAKYVWGSFRVTKYMSGESHYMVLSAILNNPVKIENLNIGLRVLTNTAQHIMATEDWVVIDDTHRVTGKKKTYYRKRLACEAHPMAILMTGKSVNG